MGQRLYYIFLKKMEIITGQNAEGNCLVPADRIVTKLRIMEGKVY